MSAPVQSVGRAVLSGTAAVGSVSLVLARTIAALPRLDSRELGRCILMFGYQSMPLVLIVAVLTGSTVVLQTALYVQHFGVRDYLGWAAGYSILWEFGPLFLGLFLAARVGSRNAAELALLKIGGQLEGFEGISIDPFALLVAPRVVATCLTVACLSSVSFLVAIVCEAATALIVLRLPVRAFFTSFGSMIAPGDLWGGCAKALAFGAAIALVSTASGLSATGGARGVGRTVATSVVFCCAAIFALDFALTPLLARLLG